MSKRILITGAAGFWAHHAIEHVLRTTDMEIVAFVRVGKVGTLERLHPILEAHDPGGKRVEVIWHDFLSPVPKFLLHKLGRVSWIIHAAAETHVDRSIQEPASFARANVMGTVHALDMARWMQDKGSGIDRFLLMSTDEVYGPAPDGIAFTEHDRHNPTNPYSAAKSGAEAMVNAYGNTYGLPVITANCMNLIGERQDSEKLVPKVIKTVLNGDIMPIHADKTKTRAGTRQYLHCRNAAAALLFLLQHGEQRNSYNVCGEKEIDNLSLAQMIAKMVGKPLKYEMVDFHSSRPGHDLAYRLDGTKLREMGFRYPVDFETSLERMVKWTLENREWLA